MRLGILGVVVISLFAALFARVYFLQVVTSEDYQEVSQVNRIREIREDAPRGRILDVQGRVLVDNRTSLVVTVERNALGDLDDDERDELIERLAIELTAFGAPTKVASIESRLEDPQFGPLQPVPVAIDVPAEFQLFLAERSEQFPAVSVRRESVRDYPHGSVGAHLLGYVGRISADELEERMGADGDVEHPKPYGVDSAIGKTGVEWLHEDVLRGTPGITRVEVDSLGRPVNILEEQPPVPGDDLVLTVDLDVQVRTEAELAVALESRRGQLSRRERLPLNAPAGASVVLDPRNGAVVALASYPTYDPSDFVNGISTERFEQLTAVDPTQNPLTNRAVSGLYAPGSVFKPVTAYGALTTGMIEPATTIDDPGFYRLPDCRGAGCEVQNAGRQAHGSVDLARSLLVSSNTYYYWLGDRAWRERDVVGDPIQASARQFGLGETTGLGLPDEAAGLLFDPEAKMARHEDNPEAFPEGVWYAGDNVNLAIGQANVFATPVQIANVYAVLANGGTRYRPQLARAVIAPGGDVDDPDDILMVFESEVAGELDLPPGMLEPMERGLAGVVYERGGTATAAFAGWDQVEFPLAGKTGTSNVSGKADNSLFVAYGPLGAPRYVAVAVLEESGYGAEAAAPMIRRILAPLAGQEPESDGTVGGVARD